MDRLLQKFKAEEAKSLKRSGTKEEYTELCQLLEDIASYVKDCEELKNENGKMIKKKEAEDKQKGEEMRKAAMEGLAKRKRQRELHSASPVSPLEISSAEDVGMDEEELDESKKGLKRRRASTLTAIEFTEKKFLKKAELKEKELVLRRVELELQQKKIEAEEEERKQRLQLEMEERRAIIEMLNRR